MKVKNFAIWLRYNSRSGTHNMYKEYRGLSRAEAVESMYQDMAARHRARFGSIHVRTLGGELELTIRSSRLLRLRRPRTSAVLTSSSSPPRTCASLCPTAALALRASTLASALRRSTKRWSLCLLRCLLASHIGRPAV